MDSVEKLLTWVIASDGRAAEKQAARAILLAHFADEDEDGMDEYKLNQIVGTYSMLSMIIAPIRYAVIHDPAFGWCTSPTSQDCHTSNLRRYHLEDVTAY